MFSSNSSQVSNDAVFVEDVFSTYLYTGNGSTQTITNGIDLSTKGGLVWIKSRSNIQNQMWMDSARGAGNSLSSNLTDAQYVGTSGVSFGSNNFSVSTNGNTNTNALTYASWTFRKQPKFFDIQTFTGNATYGGTFNHNLGSVPGCVIIKTTGVADIWYVWHRGTTGGFGARLLQLNATDAEYNTGLTVTATDTTVTIPNYELNSASQTYVAYLFAHDAGGFGLTGTDNVISCGSFSTGNGGKILAPVNLGYEAQWLLAKNVDSAENWVMYDIMRGMNNTGYAALNPNTSGAEYTGTSAISPTATGFDTPNASGPFASFANYIYIAIRRGPMKVPTSGTSVFGLNARSGTGANATVTGGQTDDAVLIKNRGSAVANLFASRLTGTGYLVTSSTAAEVTAGATILQANPWDVMDGVKVGTTSTATNASSNTFINYLFKRAPSFFDEVCITGASPQVPRAHNLTVVPQIIITKKRSGVGDWAFWYGPTDIFGYLNRTDAFVAAGFSSYVTATTFYPLDEAVGATYVNYLFATCAGVSKVGSYTGTGTTQQINCGFTGGARFVLIKRTDSTGDWYVWDTARGIVSGNDPYLLLNSTAAETTGTDYIDTYSAGFEISSTAPAAINASGGTFIFLAIA